MIPLVRLQKVDADLPAAQDEDLLERGEAASSNSLKGRRCVSTPQSTPEAIVVQPDNTITVTKRDFARSDTTARDTFIEADNRNHSSRRLQFAKEEDKRIKRYDPASW